MKLSHRKLIESWRAKIDKPEFTGLRARPREIVSEHPAQRYGPAVPRSPNTRGRAKRSGVEYTIRVEASKYSVVHGTTQGRRLILLYLVVPQCLKREGGESTLYAGVLWKHVAGENASPGYGVIRRLLDQVGYEEAHRPIWNDSPYGAISESDSRRSKQSASRSG